jgi:hypothetical protein
MSFIITSKAGITDLSQENSRNCLFKPEKKADITDQNQKKQE